MNYKIKRKRRKGLAQRAQHPSSRLWGPDPQPRQPSCRHCEPDPQPPETVGMLKQVQHDGLICKKSLRIPLGTHPLNCGIIELSNFF